MERRRGNRLEHMRHHGTNTPGSTLTLLIPTLYSACEEQIYSCLQDSRTDVPGHTHARKAVSRSTYISWRATRLWARANQTRPRAYVKLQTAVLTITVTLPVYLKASQINLLASPRVAIFSPVIGSPTQRRDS